MFGNSKSHHESGLFCSSIKIITSGCLFQLQYFFHIMYDEFKTVGENYMIWKLHYLYSSPNIIRRTCHIAQAIRRRLPTATARVRARVKSCGICGGQSVTGAGSLQIFRFSLPIRIPPIVPHSSSIFWGWYNRPNSGRSTKWTQSDHMRNILWCAI
jgi:hypothetical protein